MTKGLGLFTRARLLWRSLVEVQEQETAALDRIRRFRERTAADRKEMEETVAQSKATLANAFRNSDEHIKNTVAKKAVIDRSLKALEDQARIQQQLGQKGAAASDPYGRAVAAAAEGMASLEELKKGEGAQPAPRARTPPAPR